jgi:hypothetical protein
MSEGTSELADLYASFSRRIHSTDGISTWGCERISDDRTNGKKSVNISHVTVDRNKMSGLRKCGRQSSRPVGNLSGV